MIDHLALGGLNRLGIHLGVERMRSFLSTLGDPHLSFPAVHIAGTNGKFSVAAMVAAVLSAEGYRVGLNISPHLQRLNERISVSGVEIPDDELDRLLCEVDEARRRWARNSAGSLLPEGELITSFELLTAAAFLYLARQGVDVAVIEVGLGGRLDATNVLDGVVSAITSVGMDHMNRLGPDLASIAAEKAGILKAGRPAVLGPLPPPALRVVRAIAHERGAPLIEPGAGYRVSGRCHAFHWTSGNTTLRDLSVSVLGDHQLENAGVALAALHNLPSQLAVSERAIRDGLGAVRLPGRLEWLAPDLLVDSAHNPDGASRLAAFLQQLPKDRPRHLVLGMSSDKDARAVAAALRPCVDRIFTVSSGHERALPPGDLAAQLVALDVPVLPAGGIAEALPLARGGDALVIVAGSVFLAGAVRDLVGAP